MDENRQEVWIVKITLFLAPMMLFSLVTDSAQSEEVSEVYFTVSVRISGDTPFEGPDVRLMDSRRRTARNSSRH